jgi:hypothetical protein
VEIRIIPKEALKVIIQVISREVQVGVEVLGQKAGVLLVKLLQKTAPLTENLL